jgi:hypothetical protein
VPSSTDRALVEISNREDGSRGVQAPPAQCAVLPRHPGAVAPGARRRAGRCWVPYVAKDLQVIGGEDREAHCAPVFVDRFDQDPGVVGIGADRYALARPEQYGVRAVGVRCVAGEVVKYQPVGAARCGQVSLPAEVDVGQRPGLVTGGRRE